MSDKQNSLTEVNSEFPTIRLKFGVNRRTEKIDEPPENLPIISLDRVESWTGRVKKNGENGSDASTGLVMFKEGDVLFNKLRPYLAKAFAPSYTGAASPEFIVLHPKEFNQQYLNYLVLSEEFIKRVNASTYGAKMPRASWDFIGDLQVPVPDKTEQYEIVEFLNYHVDLLDSLIDRKRRLIELLIEKETSLINEHVKGRPTKAGSEESWFDEVPEDWSITKLKFVADIIDTKHRTAKYVDEGIPIVSPSEISPGRLSLEGANHTTPSEYEDLIEGGRKPEKGDIVYSRNASVGAAALVDTEEKFCMGQDLCLIKTEGSGTYLHYVLNSPPVLQQVESIMVGATFNRINVADIRELKIAWPSKSQQINISDELDVHTEQLKRTREKLKSGIDLLHEKRKAIVTAAITGQIDVTDWVPPEEQEITA